MDDVSAKFPNCLRACLGDQDSSPPQNSECQENKKLQLNIKGRKESVPSLNPIPSIHVKASSKSHKVNLSNSQSRTYNM